MCSMGGVLVMIPAAGFWGDDILCGRPDKKRVAIMDTEGDEGISLTWSLA